MNFFSFLGFTNIQSLTASETLTILIIVSFMIILIVSLFTASKTNLFGSKLFKSNINNNKSTMGIVKINQAIILSLKSFHWLNDCSVVHYIRDKYINGETDHEIYKLTDHFNNKVILIKKDHGYYYFQEFFEQEDINIHDIYIDLTHDDLQVFPPVIDLMNQNIGYKIKNSQDHFVLLSKHTSKQSSPFLYAIYQAKTIDGLLALKWVDSVKRTSGIYVGIIIDEVEF